MKDWKEKIRQFVFTNFSYYGESMIDKMIKSLTLEEKIGQLLCVEINKNKDPSLVEEYIKKVRPGGIFVVGMTKEQIKFYTDMVNKCTKVPVIVSSDIEHGPKTAIVNEGELPVPMAWGACNCAELLYEASVETAKICRQNGVHWTFSPVVDINYNFRSPECNVRAVSDSPEIVKKIAGAVVKGMQKDGMMATAVKHFPGQGIDERNSHFATCINHLSKEEWMATYGEVYREMFRCGTQSVMLGHVSLPAFEDDFDEFYGAPPAGISYSLVTKLLKGELGFKGCVVSDALSMIGISASIDDVTKLCVKFMQAGGDMLLYPEENDYDTLLAAVKSGELSQERVDDALRRIFRLKKFVKLIGDDKFDENCLTLERPFHDIAQEIADRSITLIRDYKKILPIKLEKGAKVLLINMMEPYSGISGEEFLPMIKELEARGYSVDVLNNPDHKKINESINDYSLVLLNLKYSSRDYHGGTLRIGWGSIMTMWRAYILKNPNVVAVSFGDPYKLFDMPYLKEYINAYYPTREVQIAVVKAILGEIPFMGKSPVEFKGYFNREVEDSQ